MVPCLALFQESQAIPLVSVASVLGEGNPGRVLRRQQSGSEDPGAEITGPLHKDH